MIPGCGLLCVYIVNKRVHYTSAIATVKVTAHGKQRKAAYTLVDRC